MKMPSKFWLLAALVAPGLSLADGPAPQPQALAIVEAIVEHCAKLVPEAADQYREHAKLVSQGAGDEALAKVRKSNEYRELHDSTIEALTKLGDQEAKKACEQLPPLR